jgi:hypothetical protein
MIYHLMIMNNLDNESQIDFDDDDDDFDDDFDDDE